MSHCPIRFAFGRSLLAAAILLALSPAPDSRAADAAATVGRVVVITGKVLAREEKGARKLRELKFGDTIVRGEIINTDSQSSIKLLMIDKTVVDLGPSTLFKVDEFKPNGGGDRNVHMSMDYGKTRMSVNQPVIGKGKFLIRTKSATMGVRGTEFIIASELKALSPGDTPGARASKAGVGDVAKAVKSSGGEGARPGDGRPPERTQSTTSITVLEGKVDVAQASKPGAAPIAVTQGKQMIATSSMVGDKVVAEVPGLGAASGSKSGAGAKSGGASAPTDVPPAQMAALSKSTKVEDKTFTQSVVVDQGSGGKGGGAATLAAASEAMTGSLAGFKPPMPAELQTPGTFTSNFGSSPPPPPQAGIPVRLQVSFQK